MIVSNEMIVFLYLVCYVVVIEVLGKIVVICILFDGEKYKNIEYFNLIFDVLLELGFNCDCIVLVLGGGVIGDMVGFVLVCF